MAACIDVIAVRRPGRTVDEPATLARNLLRVLSVDLHGPDVPQAVAVRGEGDSFAVRAEAGLHVERGSAGDSRRRAAAAAVDGHDVDVAEQIEHELPAVGTDVDVHPRPFVRVEGDLRGRAE